MQLVRISGPGVLAYVLPTASGGTEVVYLAGEPQDRLPLTRKYADEVGNGLCGIDGVHEVPHLDASSDRVGR